MLFLVLDLEVVEQGLEVALSGKAGVQQEALDARPFSEAPIFRSFLILHRSIGKKKPFFRRKYTHPCHIGKKTST